MIPTRRLAAAAALTAPVWLLSSTTTGFTIASAVSALVLVAAIGDALALPGRRQLQLRRQVPASLGLGDPGVAHYQITSSWPLALQIELHDALAPAITTPDAGVDPRQPWRITTFTVPARAATTISTSVTGRERGEHELRPPVLRVRGPLGLMQRSLRYDSPDRIAVVPSIAGVRRYRLLALQHRLRDLGVRTVRRRGEGASFANLREYVSGDDPRHVDWKASARRSKLITREYAAEQGQTVLIAIDAGRLMTQIAGQMTRFEHALTSATVLADIAIRSGDQVGLLIFNDEVRAFIPPGKGIAALQRIRDAMIPVRATLVEPDYAGAFRTLATRHRKRSLLVMYTDVIDPRASRALISHTARSTARHLPLVIALQNDELMHSAAPRGAGNAHQLYRHASAEELLLEREEALARMRQAGVSVLDVSPLTMTAAVVNRYLAIKARAAL